MNGINWLDLKNFVVTAMTEVFEAVLSMKMGVLDEDQDDRLNGNRTVGSIGFAGKVSGNLNIHVSDEFAKAMTAGMLGVEIDEIGNEADIHDVIGETSNMVGGNLKSQLCDTGLPCELSIPSITSGGMFRIDSMNWTRCEKIFFNNHKHVVMVEVFMKSGS